MPQVTLDFNLPSELVLNITFEELLLIKHFESHNELAFLFSCQINMSELASSKGLSNLKVIDGPLLAVELLLQTTLTIQIQKKFKHQLKKGL